MRTEGMESKEMKVYHVGLFCGKRFIRNFEVEAESELDAIDQAENWIYYASLTPNSPIKMLGCAWSIKECSVRDIHLQFKDGYDAKCALKINHLHLLKKGDQVKKVAH